MRTGRTSSGSPPPWPPAPSSRRTSCESSPPTRARTASPWPFARSGRVERTLFLLDWLTDRDLQRRARIGLNKGEAHHALKRALFFNRLGELRDRTREDQAYRAAGLNLLAAAITYWNTLHLGAVVAALDAEGRRPSAETLAHVSPLAWEHITLTGEYRWGRATAPATDP